MADNLLVINAAGATTAIRALDNGTNGTTLTMMSVPANAVGTALIPSGQLWLPVAAATVPSLLNISAVSGAPVAVAIKATAGTLKSVNLYNNNTTIPVFLKVYNLTAGAVTSATNPLFNIGVPPGWTRDAPLGDGAAFTTAMSYLITGLIASNDTTAVSTNDLVGALTFL